MVYWIFDFDQVDTKRWQSVWRYKMPLIVLGTKKPRERKRYGNCFDHISRFYYRFLQLFYWIQGAVKAIMISKEDDVVFFWFDFQAIICFLISRITFRKRNIVALNVMLKFNESIKGRLYKAVYKQALKSKRFHCSVTSKNYGKYLNEKMGINRDYEVIHDYIAKENYVVSHEFEEYEQNTVFMGGTSSRDWAFAIELANSIPEVSFNFVMSEADYWKYHSIVGGNVVLRTKIPSKEFFKLLVCSDIVINILNTEAPAGLIILHAAAENHKFIMVNRNATNEEYVSDDRGAILSKDLNLWKEKILYYLSNKNEAKIKAEMMYDWMHQACSDQQFVSGMERICERIYGGDSMI